MNFSIEQIVNCRQKYRFWRNANGRARGEGRNVFHAWLKVVLPFFVALW